jgi:hypothetical protein
MSKYQIHTKAKINCCFFLHIFIIIIIIITIIITITIS